MVKRGGRCVHLSDRSKSAKRKIWGIRGSWVRAPNVTMPMRLFNLSVLNVDYERVRDATLSFRKNAKTDGNYEGSWLANAEMLFECQLVRVSQLVYV